MNTIEDILPPIDKIALESEIYYYGFINVIESYCNTKKPNSQSLPIWQHGWIPDERQIHPQAVLASENENKKQQFFVARKSEENYLKINGYTNTKAIGSPLIYVPKPQLERIPGSLLVMPVHSLAYTEHKHWKFKEYAEYIQSIRKKFSRVVACIHPSCIKHGYWAEEFREMGIEIVEGAEVHNKFALERIASLFSLFEYITTNGFGSHLAYAPFFGAKVSIAGPFTTYKKEDYSNAPFYQKYPMLLGRTVEFSSKSNLKKIFPQFFVSPEKASKHKSWAELQLGLENKLRPHEFKKVLGWDYCSLLKSEVSTLPGKVKRKSRNAITSIAPGIIKHQYRLIKYESYRKELARKKELLRLKEYPRYQKGITSLFKYPLKFVDSASLLFMYNELFKQEIYKFKTSKPNPYIIDAGANIGLSILYFKQLFPQSEIVAFEPDPELLAVLKENLTTFGYNDVQVISKALWDNETTLSFFQEGADGGRIATAIDKESMITLPTTKLRKYLEKPVDFLKIDIEGAEARVLKDCQDLLVNVERLFVEYHSFIGQEQDLPLLLSVLKNSGFRLNINNPGLVSKQPLSGVNTYAGMDMQLNIFGFKE